MTRQLLFATALLLSTTAQAATESSLRDVLVSADDTADCFLKSDMSFAAALRSISTITMPERATEETVYDSPRVSVRMVKPTLASTSPAQSKTFVRPMAPQVSGGTYRP